MKPRPLRGVTLAVVLLAGCAEADLSDLQAFVRIDDHEAILDGAESADASKIPPTPPSPLERNPFEPASTAISAGGRSTGPDAARARQPLESFPLGRLQMVGTLATRGSVYALVRDPDGITHPLPVGDYLGKNHGRIVAIRDDGIDLVELVADGNGWRRQPRSMALGVGDDERADSDNDGGT